MGGTIDCMDVVVQVGQKEYSNVAEMLEHDWGDVIWPHGLGCLGPFDGSNDLVRCNVDMRVFGLLSHAA